MNKKGDILKRTIINLIIIGLVLAFFMFAIAGKVNSRGVKQQVLEKEIALLIDSSVPGFSFSIDKKNSHGIVQSVKIEDGRIFVNVDDLTSTRGYPYFSKYSVRVKDEGTKFVVEVFDE
ncbi:MAG: hypothetical protein ABIF88_01725 [archaeon]